MAHRLRKSTLTALSWAIEDECCAVADTPVLFGAFQRGGFYEPSAARWAELSRVARSAIVFADHWEGNADDAVGPVRATLPADAAMRREWAVVCDALDSTACLSAWELPGQADVPDRQRIFEALWTVDPVAVRDAARVAARVGPSHATIGLIAREANAPVGSVYHRYPSRGALLAEAWIAAYRTIPEGRNFPGVTPALRSILGTQPVAA